MATSTIPLSEIARDPVVAAFLRRGEGDAPQFAVPANPLPVLDGGCARRAAVERWIEDLISVLDDIDGDENLEPEMAGFDPRCMDDREGDDERDDDGDRQDFDGGENDDGMFIWGGMEDGDPPAIPGYVTA